MARHLTAREGSQREGGDARRLSQSYAACARLARAAASSFYWSFWLLPSEKRRAMCALYAFSRRTDDLADNDAPAERRAEELAAWRQSLARALDGDFDDPLLPALVDAAERYSIPPGYLLEIIDGVEMDLSPRRFETFDDLREYCLRVASAVGLACIHIWGFDGEAALAPAIECGVAFQLTNILRDLKEDAAAGRVYLPLEDLERFGYSEEELCRGECNAAFGRLMEFEIDRAERHYRLAAPLFDHLSRDGRRSLNLMIAGYWRLLDEIRRNPAAVFAGRVRLNFWQKAALATRQVWRPEEMRDVLGGR